MGAAGLRERLLSLAITERENLYAYFQRKLPRSENPEDGVQETLARAAMKLSEFQGDTKLEHWLHVIAKTVAIELRRLALDREQRVETAGGRFEEDVHEPRGAEPLPLVHAEDDERRERIQKALDELRPEEREAIELNLYQGLSQSEIASARGWSLSKVKNHMRKAHDKLVKLLEGQDL